MRKKITWIAGLAVAGVLAATTAHALRSAPNLAAGAEAPVHKVLFDGIFDFFGGKKEEAGNKKNRAKKEAYYINSDEDFTEENTRAINMRPYNNSALEFYITLPKNWEAVDLTRNMPMTNATAEQRTIGDVAVIKSDMIGVQRIEMSIQTQPIKKEMSAKDWLKYFIFTNGNAIEGEVEARGPYEAAAYFNSIAGQTNLYSYIVVRIAGNTALLTRADVPLMIKEQTKYIQKKVVDSLRFAYPRESGVESHKGFALVDALRFEYPVSWKQINPDFKDLSRLSIQLVSNDKHGAISGFMRIFAIRRLAKTDLKKEMETLKQHLGEYMNIEVKQMLTSSEIPNVNGRFLFSRYETYAVAYKKEGTVAPELRLAVAGDKSWYIIVYMITPREEYNLFDWAHNVRTMEVVMESMH